MLLLIQGKMKNFLILMTQLESLYRVEMESLLNWSGQKWKEISKLAE